MYTKKLQALFVALENSSWGAVCFMAGYYNSEQTPVDAALVDQEEEEVMKLVVA